MPFHPMQFTAEVVIKAERSGRERRNVIHYRYSGSGPSPADLAVLAAHVENVIIERQEDFTALGTRWYEVAVTDIHGPALSTTSRPMNRLAAGGTQVYPGNVAHCLTKRTAFRGRSFRGRYYLFDLPEDYFNGDTINPIYIPNTTDLCNRLLQTVTSGLRVFTPSVGSKTGNFSTPMTSMTYDEVADSQRRRLTGRGR